MQDVMLDLETLGTVPGCAILSIGAVAFDEFGVAEDGFYKVITSATCEAHGLHADPATLAWWEKQTAPAAAILIQAREPKRSIPLRDALWELQMYIASVDHNSRVWGNGADFDNPIIAVAARTVSMDPKQIWKGYNGRCYRTVKNQFPDIKLVRSGTHHNALDDARSQAEHLVSICQNRGWRLA